MPVTPANANTALWRKSSYSSGAEENCIEVADGFAQVVPVRDSKAPEHILITPTPAWRAFISLVKD
ncbi:DUF397 domain-containing protein [Streptomyces sp. NPDC049879]|uniref:DUF397 domain-containing protein n=1 Tax=Streptomyces sp. NPDC049879 TaxID=3365598 RepID=UPI0037A5AD40